MFLDSQVTAAINNIVAAVFHATRSEGVTRMMRNQEKAFHSDAIEPGYLSEKQREARLKGEPFKAEIERAREHHYHIRTSILAAAVLATWGGYFYSQESAHGAAVIRVDISNSTNSNPSSKNLGSVPTLVDFRYMSKDKKPVRMGAMASALIGIKYDSEKNGLIPQKATISWAEALRVQWARKLQREDVSPATRKWAVTIVDNYASSPRDTKNVRTFFRQIDAAAREMHRSIDYGKMCSDMKITQCTALYQTMGRVRGENIAAYGMTEIFPSHNGEFNYVLLDTILRNAGENYLDSIPAGGDDLLSKGFYQFTSLAIRRDNSGQLGGVTKVDNYAGMKLSGSVVHLDSYEAHKAAFAFAVYNVSQMMKTMNEKDARALSTKCPISGITELVALAHHIPSEAWKIGRKWVRNGCKESVSNFTNRKDLKDYADKTKNNLLAIENHR